jgi:hypothetical protein
MRYVLLLLTCLKCLSAAAVNIDPVISIPHIADGGYWKTTFKFVNLGTLKARIFIQFLGSDGQIWAVPFAAGPDIAGGNYATLQFDIAPGQTVTLVTAGTAIDTSTGWAVAAQTNDPVTLVAGTTIFTQHVPGGQDQEASIPMTDAFTGDFALLFDNTAYSTGIALASRQSATVTLTAHIRDRLGKEIDQQTVILPPNGHSAFDLASLWKSTAGISGSIQFTANGSSFGAFGLRFNGNAFTTILAVATTQ